mgnify:CR=1 FL=1
MKAALKDMADMLQPRIDGPCDALLQRLDELGEIVHTTAITFLDCIHGSVVADTSHMFPRHTQRLNSILVTVQMSKTFQHFIIRQHESGRWPDLCLRKFFSRGAVPRRLVGAPKWRPTHGRPHAQSVGGRIPVRVKSIAHRHLWHVNENMKVIVHYAPSKEFNARESGNPIHPRNDFVFQSRIVKPHLAVHNPRCNVIDTVRYQNPICSCHVGVSFSPSEGRYTPCLYYNPGGTNILPKTRQKISTQFKLNSYTV